MRIEEGIPVNEKTVEEMRTVGSAPGARKMNAALSAMELPPFACILKPIILLSMA